MERNANKRRDTAAAGNNCPTESVLTWQRDAEGSPPKRKRGVKRVAGILQQTLPCTRGGHY